MLRRAALLVFLAALTPPLSLLDAQTGSLRVSSSSPTAATLGQFGDVPVSLYTGTPDIRIPLWTVQGRSLALAVELRYHGGGIRVEEIGGWAGIGWTLEAGGAITRTVRGLVDDRSGGYYFTGTTWYNPSNWPTVSATLIQNIANWSQDGEPDRFFFTFAGRSGQFVMGPTSTSGPIEYRTIPHQDLSFAPTFGSGGVGIISWLIVAEDGTRYTFGAVETNTDFNESSPISIFQDHYDEAYASSWHLTGIKTVGGDTLTLYYTPYNASHQTSLYRERFDFVNPANCVPEQVDAVNVVDMQEQRLDSIVAARHTVRFYADAAFRLDALSPGGTQQELRLDLIKVMTPGVNGVVLRQFQFQHDYSTGRLTLTNVFEKDRNNVALPPYTFTYNAMQLPLRTSYAQDLWGFYNGQDDNTTSIPKIVANAQALPGADRSPSGLHAQAGTLTRITYPTGGYNEFVWEGNDLPAYGEGPELGYMAQTWGPTSVQFTVGGSVAVAGTIYRTQNPNNCDGQFDCPFTTFSGGGQSYQWSSAGYVYVQLSPGVTYTITADPGIGTPPPAEAQIQVSWREIGPLPAAPAGGVRISELRAADGMGNVTTKKFRYRLESDPSTSSGTTSFMPAFWYEWQAANCSYFSRSSVAKGPLGSGAAIGYAEVEVWNGPNGEYGKTRHRFRTAPPDGLDFWLGSSFVFNHGGNLPFATPTPREWKRGQETEVIDYNASGQRQRRVRSTYAFRDEGTPEPTTTRSFRGVSIGHFTAALWGPYSIYVYSPFQVVAAWTYLSADTTAQFNETASDSVVTNRSYAYGNPTHLQLTELVETNSNGVRRVTRSTYPQDYPADTRTPEAAALTLMQGAKHVHSPIVEQWIIERTGSTSKVLKADLTTYREYLTGQILPYQRFVLSAPSPLP